MRTTIDLDPGLLDRLRHEAVRRGVPFKHLLNRLLRDGLQSGPAPKSARYRCPTFAMGEPAGDAFDKALALAAALDDDQWLPAHAPRAGRTRRRETR
jgi:hypothetical protein